MKEPVVTLRSYPDTDIATATICAVIAGRAVRVQIASAFGAPDARWYADEVARAFSQAGQAADAREAMWRREVSRLADEVTALRLEMSVASEKP